MGQINDSKKGSEPSLRVAMLAPMYPPAFGGGGVQASRLVASLVHRGVEVRVLCYREGPGTPKFERSTRLEVWRFGVPRIDQKRKLVMGLRFAWWLLTHRDWDLLHMHGISSWGILPILVGRLRRRPILAKTTLFIPDSGRRRKLGQLGRITTATYRRCDAIVALSSELEQYLLRYERLRAQVLRIPNGVDITRFQPTDPQARISARKALDLRHDALIIASVGRLEPRKNFVSLVTAAGQLRHRPVCIALAGPPSPDSRYAADLKRAAVGLPEGIEMRWLGQLPAPRLMELLRAADIFALVSRAEGLPNSLLEAMATGLACIASDVPGSRDVLSYGGGVLVPLDDTPRLVGELEALATNPDERGRLGQEARRIVEQHYSLDAVVDRYIETYRALLGSR